MANQAKSQADLSGERFGIEVEGYGLTRYEAAEIIRQVVGGSYIHTEYHLNAHYTRDLLGRKWTVESDGSIGGHDFSGEPCEFVSPILGMDDLPLLRQVLAALVEGGFRTDPDYCGIHVHISDEGYSAGTYRNLANMVCANDQFIRAAVGFNPAREQWAQALPMNFIEAINRQKPKEIEALGDIWYRETYGERRHYSSSRYHILNLHSAFYDHHGVEFRVFNSTTDWDKIEAYITLCAALSNRARHTKTASPKVNETTNPAYTWRCVLLKLGLSGDAFKSTRKVLMANIEGDSAWYDNRRNT